MPSHLNLLINMFSIPSKDFAKILHVDSSLVSKWCTGKRTLKPDSTYMDKIVDYIMKLDKPNNYINICKLLANKNKNVLSLTEKEIASLLKLWLASSYTLSEEDTKFDELKTMDLVDMVIFYKFQGNEGRRDAVKSLVDYAISHSPELELLCYTDEEASWFYEDVDFLKQWTEKNHQFLQLGNSIKVIHPLDRTYENISASIFRWIPLHMTGKTKACYIPKYTDGAISFTMFLIPHQIVMFGVSSKMYSKHAETYLTNDATFLENIEGILQSFFDRSLPLFKRYDLKSNVNFVNDFIEMLEYRKTKYEYCTTFSFMPMPENLIREILQYNHVHDTQISKYMELYNIITKLCMHVLNRYIINYERLQKKLNQPSVKLDSFSFLTGTNISVPKEMFRNIVQEVVRSIHYIDNVEIGLNEKGTMNYLGDINILAQENTFASFFSTDFETPLSLVTKELTTVTSVFQRLEKTWDSIPKSNKSKVLVCRQLQLLLR